MTNQQTIPPETEQEIRLLDVGTVILRRWKTLAGSVLGALLMAAVILWILPERYTARTVLLPPLGEGSGRAQMIASELSGFPVGALLGGSSSSQRLIGAIVRSRSFADSVVNRVQPLPVGAAVTGGQVREILNEHTEIDSRSDGSIAVAVSAKNPMLAAEIANAFPDLINRIAVDIGARAALQKQRFLQDQLTEAREELVQSEQRLIDFQQSSDAPELQEQARRTVDAASDLQRQVMELEVRLAQLRRTATPDNPALRSAVAELNARREQLRRLLEEGRGGERLFVPLGGSPELKLASARLLREFTTEEQIYMSLTAALTQAQIDANNDLPVVGVLDAAIVPRAPSGPNAPLILLLSGVLGLILGLLWVVISESMQEARRQPLNTPFFAAWDDFKLDLSRAIPRYRGRRRSQVVD
jgi:tyrosine-protein kinase Etk/Wzc